MENQTGLEVKIKALHFLKNMVKCKRVDIFELPFEVRTANRFFYIISFHNNSENACGYLKVLRIMLEDVLRTADNPNDCLDAELKGYIDLCPFKDSEEYINVKETFDKFVLPQMLGG